VSGQAGLRIASFQKNLHKSGGQSSFYLANQFGAGEKQLSTEGFRENRRESSGQRVAFLRTEKTKGESKPAKLKS